MDLYFKSTVSNARHSIIQLVTNDTMRKKFRQNPSSTHILEEKRCVFLQPLPFYHYLYVEAHQNIEFSVDNRVLSSKIQD